MNQPKKDQPNVGCLGQWSSFMRVWTEFQTCLVDVVRWGRFATDHAGKGFTSQLRPQNNLQHSYSLPLTAAMMLEATRDYLDLDGELILLAASVHDVGEGVLKRDIAFVDKKASDDVDEYVAFMKRVEAMPMKLRQRMQKAFLLQFCLGSDHSLYPEDARPVLADLAESYATEAMFFNAVEHLDYFMYVMEQYAVLGQEVAWFMKRFLPKEIPFLEKHRESLPGIKEEIFTDEFMSWCQDFVQKFVAGEELPPPL